ncbi:outer membrane autotransporter protein [Methylobacterium brachiatum]|uniref:Outer membrane autotransporter protein n=1 Tax=Methylobacterium brachiatum TaxID=269660 RepID=A0AAJ1U1Q3_9HYPH|nr:autotransporter domain-containing protein [Methylobacterium brachiatum]MCB4805316.1 autotransporter domain-containing protein [Methylobacterium brachiatum]MDQ0546363.1 outer membrane autotransporter protein [Methylobacterium brachiatum]
MTFRYGVSIAALMVAACGSGVQAQTVNTTASDVNVLNLLSPFLSLNATATGQATLDQNLSQTAALNNGAGLARQQLAISDKNLLASASNNLSSVGLGIYGVAANIGGGLPRQTPINGIVPQQLVGGLGTQLGPIYQRGVAQGAAGALGSVVNLLVNANTFTGNNLGVAKNYFANGAANNPSVTPANYVAVPAVAPAGYTLPTYNGLPNTTNSVYDLAYGVNNTQPGQDVYGSSRPVQVAPKRFNAFDPTALNGIATNPSFPSGHTTYAFTSGYLLAMLVPQQYQSLLLRASEYGESRIVLGVHYPLDVIGSRALSAYDLAQAFTNPAYINNAAVTGVALNLPNQFVQAQGQIQAYLAAQCGNTVAACAAGAPNITGNPYIPSAANQAAYQARLTYGLPTLSFAQAPREAAPAGGPDASILLAPLYGGSTAAARTLAPQGGLYGQLSTDTINQVVVNTETNALAAFYGSPLSYWSRIDLYAAAGYFGNVTGTLRMDATDRLGIDVGIGNGGALYANGTIAGTVSVNAGGLLGGSGSVGGVNALSGGAVAPGNSIGTLTVAGAVAFAPGSTYRVEANAAGQADRIAAGGAATLAGGTVQVQAASGAYNPRTTYAILTAAGGVSGRFDGVSANLAFLSPGLRYRPNEVDLTLTRNDVPLAAGATGRNGIAAANAIQAAGAGRAYDAALAFTTDEAADGFRALSGDIHASTVSAAYETAFFVREAVLDRLRRGGDAPGLDYGTVPAAYTADLPGRAPPVAQVPVRTLDPQVFGLWGQGFGAFGTAGGGGNAFDLDRQIAGFALGADIRLPSGVRFGLVGGYTETNLDSAGRQGGGARAESATLKSGFGGVYGGYAFGPVSVRLGALYADTDTRTRRSVLYGLSDSPTGHGGGHTVQGFGEIGYRFAFGAASALVSKDGPAVAASYIEPFVGGAYIGIRRDGFAETGGAAALVSYARDYDLGAVTAGVRAQTSLDLGFGLPLTAHGQLGYRRAFGDVVPTALLSFGSGPSFLSAGVPIDRDALVAGAGLDLAVAPNASLGVAYTGQVGARAQDQAVKGNFTLRF